MSFLSAFLPPTKLNLASPRFPSRSPAAAERKKTLRGKIKERGGKEGRGSFRLSSFSSGCWEGFFKKGGRTENKYPDIHPRHFSEKMGGKQPNFFFCENRALAPPRPLKGCCWFFGGRRRPPPPGGKREEIKAFFFFFFRDVHYTGAFDAARWG